MQFHCRLCNRTEARLLIDLGYMPIAHRMLTSSDESEETFPLALHVCEYCGLTQVVDPIDPAILYNGFNFNFSSWKPEPHFEQELDVIFANSSPESAFEIGCNDGRFLAALRDRGVIELTGVEPNPVPGKKAEEQGFRVFSEMVSPAVCDRAIAANGGRKFDLVVSRQVLEHVLDLKNFFDCVDHLLSDSGVVFIDVPDCTSALAQGDSSMIWEEHVTYFTKNDLANAFHHYGLTPKSTHYYDFSGGTVAILATRSVDGDQPVQKKAPSDIVENFQSQAITYKERLTAALQVAAGAGMPVVLYGTGCRACTVVNGLQLGALIDYAIDDQPERQGIFMPGSRLAIYDSTVVKEICGPFVCLLAVNNENEVKVKAKLHAAVGDRAICASLLGPLDIFDELSAIETACEGISGPIAKH